MTILDAQVTLTRGSFYLNVSLTVASGETVVLLGPNGAGKTTLLRALAGLEPNDSGHITLDGQVFDSSVPVEKRQIGMVFQDYALFPHMSALDNVAFGLRAMGKSKSQARSEAETWLARLGVKDKAHAKPVALSGGQAQRVSLGRALAINPRMLLLDEPLSALDVTTRLETRRMLRDQLNNYDGVCLIVTHDPFEAMALADRLIVMEEGSLVQQGSIQEISECPRTPYVADLVGLNFFRGKAQGDQVQLNGLCLTIAEKAEGEVFVVFHPRAVALHHQRPEGTPRNVWQGIAESFEFEGSRVRVRVGGPISLVAEVTPAAVAELNLVDGGPIWVAIKATEIVVYPA